MLRNLWTPPPQTRFWASSTWQLSLRLVRVSLSNPVVLNWGLGTHTSSLSYKVTSTHSLPQHSKSLKNEKYEPSSIFSTHFFLNSGLRWSAGAYLSGHRLKARCQSWQVASSSGPHWDKQTTFCPHTPTDKSEFPVRLTSMFLECGSKPENLERTREFHADTAGPWPRIEPMTFLLWGGSPAS